MKKPKDILSRNTWPPCQENDESVRLSVAYATEKKFLQTDMPFVKALALDFYQMMPTAEFTIKTIGTGTHNFHLIAYYVNDEEFLEKRIAHNIAEAINAHSFKRLINPTVKRLEYTTGNRELSIMEVIKILARLDCKFENALHYIDNMRGTILSHKLGIV